MEISFYVDVFFNELVTAEMLDNLEDWLGYPVTLSDWTIFDYGVEECSCFVIISTLPEASHKVIRTLWDNLKIPMIAYGSKSNNDDSYEKWVADKNGISNELVTAQAIAA